MATLFALTELEFLATTNNHREFRSKLSKLALPSAESVVTKQAEFVGLQWFKLSAIHLREARAALRTQSRRAAYSRAYYSAYNASKAVRYILTGWVSLKGDDHGKASDLPGDFPDRATWGSRITNLYEQRLRADYDYWTNSRRFAITPKEAIATAAEFVKTCRIYLRDTHGVAL